jgi:hypothetical protein
MCGGGLSYDVHVLLETAPTEAQERCTAQTWRQGNKYLTFEDATVPPGHRDLAPGPERWDQWCAHEKIARGRMLAVLHATYPETRGLAEWPLLWVVGLPVDRETHDMRVVKGVAAS